MIIGFLSSVIDNVPLVAAAMGMYPLTHTSGTLSPYLMNFTTDGTFWELLAYCSGIGGSILIIGSAAGVVVMGMERINFMWYMKPHHLDCNPRLSGRNRCILPTISCIKKKDRPAQTARRSFYFIEIFFTPYSE